jgi:hypothetical protein
LWIIQRIEAGAIQVEGPSKEIREAAKSLTNAARTFWLPTATALVDQR